MPVEPDVDVDLRTFNGTDPDCAGGGWLHERRRMEPPSPTRHSPLTNATSKGNDHAAFELFTAHQPQRAA